MEYNYSLRHEVFLIFKHGEGYWLQKFLRKGFGHVLMLTKDQYNWIALDPHRLKLCVVIPPYPATDDVPRMLVKDGYTVLKIVFFERSTMKRIRHSRLNNCVSFIKYALGIRVRAITPYGLFKRLLRLTENERFRNGIRDVTIIY